MSLVNLPTGRGGRLLALSITVVLVLIGWLVVVAPLVAWNAERAERLEERRLLARRMVVAAANLPQLQQAQAAGAPERSLAAVLEGTTDAVAAAVLQERLQEMAGRVGAALTSAETLPASVAGDYRRIGLHVSLTTPWSVLVRLLQLVEQASPRMLVDDLQVHGARLPSQPPDPPLEAAFTVFGFRAKAGPAPVAR